MLRLMLACREFDVWSLDLPVVRSLVDFIKNITPI